jgi:rare lipoprotein A (peptidoglycan hydrolase)
MKFIVIAVLTLAGLNARAAVSGENTAEDGFFLLAEMLSGEGSTQDQAALDESGWNGQVEQLDLRSLDQYASGDYSRIDAIAAVEKSKCRPEKGQASWYGGSFQGRKTSNGERFDTNARAEFTAAHKTLPMGTRVRVTNRKNGLSIIVRINDRGPFIRGRVIDVTREGAKALHLDGVGPVQLTCI